MPLFIDDVTVTTRPRVSGLAVVSLIVTLTGFLNVVGILVGPVLACIALAKIRRSQERGRGLAWSALAIFFTILIGTLTTLSVVLLVAYAEIPSPG